jgi:hypothetical protein
MALFSRVCGIYLKRTPYFSPCFIFLEIYYQLVVQGNFIAEVIFDNLRARHIKLRGGLLK